MVTNSIWRKKTKTQNWVWKLKSEPINDIPLMKSVTCATLKRIHNENNQFDKNLILP